MYLRQGERYIGLRFAAELHQLLHGTGVFQVGKSCGIEFTFDFYARVPVKVIIIAKIILVQ